MIAVDQISVKGVERFLVTVCLSMMVNLVKMTLTTPRFHNLKVSQIHFQSNLNYPLMGHLMNTVGRILLNDMQI